MPYCVVIGACNIDVQGSSQFLHKATSNLGFVDFSPGGVGRNIAHNLALLDIPCYLLSAIGEDLPGQMLLSLCQELGIDMSRVLKQPKSDCYLSLLEAGELFSAINDMQAINSVDESYLKKHLELINGAKALMIEANLSSLTLSFLASNIKGPKLFLDPVSDAKCKRLDLLLPQAFCIKPNASEAFLLSGEEDLAKSAEFFHSKGVQRVVISRGEKPLFFSDKLSREQGYLKPKKAEIVSVSGAGDALNSGLIYGYMNGMSFKKSLDFAMQASYLSLHSKQANNPELRLLKKD